MKFVLKTSEDKQAGFTHYDAANAKGRLLDVWSQPGVDLSFSPGQIEAMRFDAVTGDATFRGRANFSEDVHLASAKKLYLNASTHMFEAGGLRMVTGSTSRPFRIFTSSSREVANVTDAGLLSVWQGDGSTPGSIAAGTATLSGTSHAAQFFPSSRPQVSASSGTLLQDLLTALDLSGIIEKVA